MIVDADDLACQGSPYRVRVGLQNVADIPVYNASVELTAGTNYTLQPGQQLVQGTAEIDPGSTFWTGYYILIPQITGTLDLSHSFVKQTAGDTSLASTITTHPSTCQPPPPPPSPPPPPPPPPTPPAPPIHFRNPPHSTCGIYRIALPGAVGSPHFLLHFDPSTTDASQNAARLAALERGYGRLVAGAGGSPNAGLKAPLSDGTLGGDGRIDVYLAQPLRCPEPGAASPSLPDPMGVGGTGLSGFMWVTPSATGGGFAAIAIHELGHIIEFAYARWTAAGGALDVDNQSQFVMESGANWAALWGADSTTTADFQMLPWPAFDCPDSDQLCPYTRWLLVEMLAERYGTAFVQRLFATGPQSSRPAFDSAIGSAATLGASFAEYALKLWAPASWANPVAAGFVRAAQSQLARTSVKPQQLRDTGWRTTTVDPLTAQYVALIPGRRSTLTVQVAAGGGTGAVPSAALLVPAGGGSWRETALSGWCDAARCATITVTGNGSQPAAVIALVNAADPTTATTGPAERASFSWRVRTVTGPPPAKPQLTPASPRLASVLARGLRVTVTGSAGARVTVRLAVNGQLAHLLGARTGQPAEIARAAVLLPRSRRATVTLRLTARARSALRTKKSLQATLTATPTGHNGSVGPTRTTPLKLRH